MWSLGNWFAFLSGTAAAVTALCLKRSQYEREHFKIDETEIESSKIKSPRTLVFLSDLHDKEFGKDGRDLLKAIAEIRPDAVLIGGDTMVAKEGRAGLDVTRRLIHGLAAIPGRENGTHCPVYYANGNHEQRLRRETDTYGNLYQELRRLLAAEGVHYLSDSSALLGDDIRISGLDLDPCYYRDLIPARMKSVYLFSRLGRPDAERYQVLMAHSPLFCKAYAEWGADLALSGHFHGGTIRLPLLGGVMTPQYQFFLPCCAGTFETCGHYMIVSRGLGTHSINIRLGNRPQVVVVRLKPKA